MTVFGNTANKLTVITLLHEEKKIQLTPANADEHPLAQLVCGVGEHDGCVEVAALAKHPEEVGGVKIIEGGCDKTAPYLKTKIHSLNYFIVLQMKR